MRNGIPLFVLCFSGLAFSANLKPCAGSVPVGTFQLRMTPAKGGQPLPILKVRGILQGSKLTYAPVQLPPDGNKNARVALVIVPASDPGASGVTVLEPLPADNPGGWTVPFTASVVLLVFGPQGLDEKRLANLVSKEDDLVAELASYAGQTEDLEATIESLAAAQDEGPADDREQQADSSRGSPASQALYTLMRALNPVVTAYNPLGTGQTAGPATLMGKASGAFFDNAGSVVPGGGALPVMKSFLMPDTEFRSVYAEGAKPDGLTLCAQRRPGGSRNRIAYIWARRAINSGPPKVALAQTAWLPLGARATVPIRSLSGEDWPLIGQVREWELVGAGAPVPVKVQPDTRRTIVLDLRGAAAPPGVYRLEGKWDWQTLPVAGDVRLAPAGEASRIRLAEGAQERLVAGSGRVAVRLEGTDFQFVERMTLQRTGRLGAAPLELGYTLPLGPRAGPQQAVEVEIDTGGLHAGEYRLALTQTGGSTQEAPLRVLAPPPKIEGLPLRVNLGAGEQRLLLRGADLARVEAVSCDGAAVRLGPAASDEREIFVSLNEGVEKGRRLTLQLGIGGVAGAVRLAGALLVTGPRPRLAAAKVSLPENTGVALREGELLAGSFVGFSFETQNLESPAALRLDCAESALTLEAQRVRAGEKRSAARVIVTGDNKLFVSFDPGAVGQPGCTVAAVLETEAAGASEPMQLGRVVRLPLIESIALTEEKAEAGYIALLKGRDLGLVRQTGWDAARGLAVPAPPRGLAGEGDLQTLRVVVPWPSPAPLAPLFVWLPGDTVGRAVARAR
ncbi:MAG: hypothetical protein HY822_10255 [Acidobacteria bacterium]|nr:hypothetical protein [Acidobacteriota bacterium]